MVESPGFIRGRSQPFVLFDAMHIKVRRQGGVRSTAILIAVGTGEDGQREILDFHPALQESGGAWKMWGQLPPAGAASDADYAGGCPGDWQEQLKRYFSVSELVSQHERLPSIAPKINHIGPNSCR